MDRLTERDQYGHPYLMSNVSMDDVIEKLCKYEEIGIEPEEAGISVYVLKDIPEEALVKIREAFADGRLVIRPKPITDTCGSCYFYNREGLSRHGYCAWRVNKYSRLPLYVTQGRKGCKDYMDKEG